MYIGGRTSLIALVIILVAGQGTTRQDMYLCRSIDVLLGEINLLGYHNHIVQVKLITNDG
jgi:hypothetical protein